MTGKTILDRIDKIVKRQDFDRSLALGFVNDIRKALIRDKTLRKFEKLLDNVVVLNGNKIDMSAYKIKQVKIVEWLVDDPDGTTHTVRLDKLFDYKSAMDVYGSMTKVGNPKHYVEIGTDLYILPAFTEGRINIHAEVFPDDLLDDINSADILSKEIGEVWVYLGAAEYFDMLGEIQTGQFWRQKGLPLFDQYIKQLKNQEVYGLDLLARDPFGNTPVKAPTKVTYDTLVIDDLDAGGW